VIFLFLVQKIAGIEKFSADADIVRQCVPYLSGGNWLPVADRLKDHSTKDGW